MVKTLNCQAVRKIAGFTLIELSIVLVIIGLIVGGVLVGRDLIAAAAVRAQISQIEKFNQAVNAFNGKYGGLPGDLSLPLAVQYGFNTSGCDGTQAKRDGNGLIESDAASPAVLNGAATAEIDGVSRETELFWQDLSDSKLIEASSLVPVCLSRAALRRLRLPPPPSPVICPPPKSGVATIFRSIPITAPIGLH